MSISTVALTRKRIVSAFSNAGMIPNIKEEPPQPQASQARRKRLFNAAIHALRMRVERTFAWEDKFKRLLLRFEHIQHGNYGMKLWRIR